MIPAQVGLFEVGFAASGSAEASTIRRRLNGVDLDLKQQIAAADRGMRQGQRVIRNAVFARILLEERTILRVLEVGYAPGDIRPPHPARLQQRGHDAHGQIDLARHVALVR